MIKIAPLLAPALVLALTGCSLAPQYQRPEMELPQAWGRHFFNRDSDQMVGTLS